MVEKGLYYIDPSFKTLVMSVGGQWNDTKHRPIVCLIKSKENPKMYWAIPMGKYNHRNDSQIKRIESYINRPEKDIASCYYHIGRTTCKSIFFISDAVPITDKYIKEEHLSINQQHYIIKNSQLIAELSRKLFRILAYENAKPNHFRQHITAIKYQLLVELNWDDKNACYKV